MGFIQDPDNSKKQVASGITFNQKQKDAMAWPLENVTGSLTLKDDNAIKDAGGDTRFDFDDAGSLVLYDESGNAGITLNTDQTTTFANSIDITNHITASGNISGSSTSNLTVGGHITASAGMFNNLPTSDPAVAGALFTTGSTTMGLGSITGSGWQVVAVSQG